MKNKKIIISVCIVVIVIFIAIIIINNNKKITIKNGSEVQDILSYNDYKTYFSYGSNHYDKKLNCYEYDYSEKIDCDRKIKFWNFISINIKGKDSNIEFDAYATLDKDNKIDVITINIEKPFSKKSYYQYTISNDGKEEYFSSSDDDWNECYIVKKTEELREDKLEKCSKFIQKDIDEFKKEFTEELNKLDLTIDDLFSYFEWYANKYAIPQYKKSRNDLNNKLSYQEMLDNVQKKYEISIGDDNEIHVSSHSVDYYIYNLFSFSIENNKVTSMFYQNSSYKKYALYYNVKNEKFYGGDYGVEGSKECLAEMNDDEKEFANNYQTLDNYYCTKNDENQINYIKLSYDYELNNNLQLTEKEFVSFIEQYYMKNAKDN